MIEAVEHFEQFGLPIYVYKTAEAMGAASAEALAKKQIALAAEQDSVGMLVMAAPSAFSFYNAYVAMTEESTELQQALARAHFFQFDDYPLPADHPASFRYLLNKHFFSRLAKWCPAHNFHALAAESNDAEKACREYTQQVLKFGLDMQIKGVGENGHWGFHEPGVPLDGDPAYITVDLSEENVQQQMRDHPDLFAEESEVPTVAFTANVALFMKTRTLIEDNIPQASKGFALVVAYGNETVDACVPTSILKRHGNAVVRTTSAAARELIEFRKHGIVSKESFERMATAMGGDSTGAYIRAVFETMGIAVES
ncbi:MAG: 6-phosphogluconolactonase [Candidatus Hydrogenedentota bacterium]